jgi:hypothetical protein
MSPSSLPKGYNLNDASEYVMRAELVKTQILITNIETKLSALIKSKEDEESQLTHLEFVSYLLLRQPKSSDIFRTTL